VIKASGKHPVPFRTRKLSLSAPMVLHGGPCGRLGRRRTTQHLRVDHSWSTLRCFYVQTLFLRPRPRRQGRRLELSRVTSAQGRRLHGAFLQRPGGLLPGPARIHATGRTSGVPNSWATCAGTKRRLDGGSWEWGWTRRRHPPGIKRRCRGLLGSISRTRFRRRDDVRRRRSEQAGWCGGRARRRRTDHGEMAGVADPRASTPSGDSCSACLGSCCCWPARTGRLSGPPTSARSS
jgi:hypothetical protein